MKTPWLRLVLAISLDGRLALPNGSAAPIGGKGDKRVLEKALAWADGALIGGKTLLTHRSTCLIHNHHLLQQRRMEGRSAQPLALVVSKKKNFSPEWPFFRQPIHRWLLTPNNLQESNARSPNGFERTINLHPQWSDTLKALKKEGLSRLLVLGGAHLATSLLEADQIDELQLTLTPKVIGGKHTWIPSNSNSLPKQLSDSEAWKLKDTHQLINNELMLNYERNR